MYKPELLSEGAELLTERCARDPRPYDVVIVGSGYGGSVAAARLAGAKQANGGANLRVCVIERGREHLPGTFPNNFSELPGEVRFSRFDEPLPKGVSDGLFDFRIGKDISVLLASGLGGGSLINAGVAEPADPTVFASWPDDFRRDLHAFGDHYATARRMLEAQPVPPEHDLRKRTQFVALARAANLDVAPAHITVTHRSGPNRHGVQQEACVNCGDCATGCNYNAKNTLSTNYLAIAYRNGAELYTGGTVLYIERDESGAGDGASWRVYFDITAERHPSRRTGPYVVRARHVILSAGSFGSTEILMRSKERSRSLQFSLRLGSGFSTNGDMISCLYAQNEDQIVKGVAAESEPFRQRQVGPTITTIARRAEQGTSRLVIEELAIPGALRRLFGEVLTTSALLERFARIDREPHGREAIDPASVDNAPGGAIERTQVLAAMGDDEALGTLELVPGWEKEARRGRLKDGAVRVHWPRAADQDVYSQQDDLLGAVQFRGGTYLRSPLWQPLPPSLTSILSGAVPQGLLFSVHPLGGCAMGDDATNGVVNHLGRVFAGAKGKEVHKGLLVLDGSIIPTALGINPLLTITALAERAIEQYKDLHGWTESPRDRPIPRRRLPERAPVAAVATELRFSEQMIGQLTYPTGRTLDSTLTVNFDTLPNLEQFLTAAAHPVHFTGTLRVANGARNGPETQVDGNANLLVRAQTTCRQRILCALWTFLSTRHGDLIVAMLRRLNRSAAKLFHRMFGAGVVEKAPRGRGMFRGYLGVASNAGEVRYLDYEVTLQGVLRDETNRELLPAGSVLRGRKTLAYRRGGNPWRQLTDLPLKVRDGAPLGVLSVDLAHFFRRFTTQLQVRRVRDLPMVWMELGSLAMFLMRIIAKIHFWSFRLPDYQKYDPQRDIDRLPGPLPGCVSRRYVVGYPETPLDAGVFLPIMRYRKDTASNGEPVLLIHGLGSGGIQFATRLLEKNLAQHLVEQGFDVWVAELRTSIALPYSLDQWKLDEVARGDIPRIIDFVLAVTEQNQLSVVAHCIGSAMFCSAALAGLLQHSSGASKIRRAALLQVGPLISLSTGTRARSLFIEHIRRFLPDGHVDFSVDDRAGWLEGLIDRLLATYPYPAAEARRHGVFWFGNHHIANCNRGAAIDGRMFQHDNLSKEMLLGLGQVLGHSSITTWEQTLQYAFLERLTDSDARNTYVTRENIGRYMNFPVAMLSGGENDVFHPLTGWRTRELLRGVNGPGAAKLYVIPGYGHLDPLIGRHAYRDVYPRISRFLANATLEESDPMPATQAGLEARSPLVGPILGSFQQTADGTWTARIWCRIDDLRSPVSSVLVLVYRNGTYLRCQQIDPGTGNPENLSVGPIDTRVWADVTLDQGPGTYRIRVVSVHEGSDAASPAHAAAEFSLHREPIGLGRISGLDNEGIAEFAIRAPAAVRPAQRTCDSGYDDKIDSVTLTVPEAVERQETARLAAPKVMYFAVGSCRYPGQTFDRERADAVFGSLLAHKKKPAAVLLVGDQIYADATAGAFDPKSSRERFYESYREAWTAPNARLLLSRQPVYMMLDDHEVGDNWHPQDDLDEEQAGMRHAGMRAFAAYQWIHSPRNAGSDGRRPSYHYHFIVQGFPFFMCDTRTRRHGRDRIMGQRQFRMLRAWLQLAQRRFRDRPKFVVSPSVIVPFVGATGASPATAGGAAMVATGGPAAYVERSDGWDGFPDQLSTLFSFIVAAQIENVVFLCGDPHLAMHSDIWFERPGTRAPIAASCIVASPIYAPYPFANATADDFVLDNAARPLLLTHGWQMRYRVRAPRPVNRDSITVVETAWDGQRWAVNTNLIGMSADMDYPGVPQPAPAHEPLADWRVGQTRPCGDRTPSNAALGVQQYVRDASERRS